MTIEWSKIRGNLPWDENVVPRIIDPFSEDMPDYIFKAVHCDWDLMIAKPEGQKYQELRDYHYQSHSMPNFLHEFLNSETQVLSVVLGGTGTGKSHLVHWMNINIPENENQIKILVKKSKTSLREIVSDIIRILPKDKQESYLEEFNLSGGETLDEIQKRVLFLNNLGLSISEKKPTDEREEELVDTLPDLFSDPYFRRKYFLKDDSVVTSIINHIFALSKSSNRPDSRIEFKFNDIPISGGEDFSNASVHAQNVINLILSEEEEGIPAVLDLINKPEGPNEQSVLDRAIARTLSFSGDRIETLFTDLRKYLFSQGKELILLIEEFARLQGVDRTLAQAISTKEGPDKNLCLLRTAIAVTTGYYETIQDTFYTRTSFIVNMDMSAGKTGESVSEESLAKYVSRYLNVVKIGQERLEEWSNHAQPGELAPSACENNEFKELLHSTFGEVDGYGLYPFTKKSIWNLVNLVDQSNIINGRMNPRTIQNSILKKVLNAYAYEIKDGVFPSLGFFEEINNRHYKMDNNTRSRLETMNARNNERWLPFLEIYDGSGEIKNLNENLMLALNIPTIPIGDNPPPPPPPEPEPEPEPRPKTQVDKIIDDIEKWSRGDELAQQSAQKIRELLYDAIVDRINWDELGYIKKRITDKSPRGYFQTKSISFDKQATEPIKYVNIKIKIPSEYNQISLTQSASALTTLYKINNSNNNSLSNISVQELSIFSYCLDVWTEGVVQKLKNYFNPNNSWDLAEASLELLVVLNALGGRININEKEVVSNINGIFQDSPLSENCSSVSKEINEIYRKLCKNHDLILNTIKILIYSSKGGQEGTMISPSKLHEPLDKIIKTGLKLQQEPLGIENQIAEDYNFVKSKLKNAINKEIEERQKWINNIKELFGAEENMNNFVEKISNLIKPAVTAALNQGIGIHDNPLKEKLENFEKIYFEQYFHSTTKIINDDMSIYDQLILLGVGNFQTKNISEEFFGILDNVTQIIENYVRDNSAGSAEVSLDSSIEEIEKSINLIDKYSKNLSNI